jgi:hypothetical protein
VIERAADGFRLVINPVIYAEGSIRYSRIEELDAALPKTMFDREAIPPFRSTGDREEPGDPRLPDSCHKWQLKWYL